MTSFLLLSTLAFAGGPLAPRTPGNPYLPNVEFAMDLPPNGCGPDEGCVTVLNTGGTYLEISNNKFPGPTQVVDGEGYTVGVYMDAFPNFKGMSVDETTGKPIPIYQGEFVSVMDPCKRSGNNKRTYVQVGAAKSIDLSATRIIFHAEPVPDMIVRDANTWAIVKIHWGWGERAGSGGGYESTLHSGEGQSTAGYEVRLGNGRCKDQSD